MSKIAVIGAGISGMAASYLLSRKHEVWLFEKEARLGGHTHTHQIETSSGTLAMDTGFIVHNERTYPNLIRLLAELGVERQKSDMSFGVASREDGMEYSSRGLGGFFATRRNWLRPSHYRLLSTIARFNRVSTAFLRTSPQAELTLGQYLRANNFGNDFARLYLYPMASAVWSTSLEEIKIFPALTLLRFFDNHGFLSINRHHQWYSVRGGSSRYIAPITAPYKDRIQLSAGIRSVVREQGKPVLYFADTPPLRFDEVVFACDAPQGLTLLRDASSLERSVLGRFEITRNQAVLHCDDRFLPSRMRARASWNYHLGDGRAPSLTYHVNRLQQLPVPENYCVTLNAAFAIKSSTILREMTYYHPLYTLDAIRAQARWGEISGTNHTHFCGAYWFNGFHEDGLNSALRTARSLGVNW